MPADVSDLSMPALEREITTLAGHLAAATCRFLELLAVFDSGGGWHGTGMRTCAQWLSWKCGLSPGTARDQLRVAHALEGLPAVRDAFAAGRLSYSKARALARVATPEDERALVDAATACTASQLDRLCSGVGRARNNAEVLDQAARASFTARWAEDGTLRFSGCLSAEDGAALLAALAAVRPDPVTAPAVGPIPGEDAERTAGPDEDSRAAATVARPDAAGRAAHSDAVALVLLAEHALSDPPPAAVGTAPVRLVIHTITPAYGADTSPIGSPTAAVDVLGAAHSVSAEAPGATEPVSAETPTVALLDAGPHVPPVPLGPDTLRRLACEALVEPAAHPDAEEQAPVQHRFATARQRRALFVRDGGCAFPGCPRRRGLHAHHLKPWHQGGSTTMENLALVCTHHHGLVHEGGWRLRRRPDHRWDAVHPDGRVVPSAPRCSGATCRLPTTHDADIRPRTVTGTWAGERLELDYAVSVFASRGV